MKLEHISKGLDKYKKNHQQLNELNLVRQEIVKKTGINPISIKKSNDIYIVKVNNQYEALEVRSITKFNIRAII